ncbi:MAG: hypothetical protein M1840_001992 [Geoglossum simile]|nr:MAG: hypothetical protein M1840_001992 [Geoglossum simile]
MAKSARSSVKKANKSKLRARVFGPVEIARTERLSAKLLQLATESAVARPDDTAMELVDKEQQVHTEDDMEVDEDPATATTHTIKTKTSRQVQRKRRGKPSSSIVFHKITKARGKGGSSKGKK